VFDATTGTLRLDFLAYSPAFTGGVRVGVGDVNGDGVPDIITAPGPSGGPDIRVFDGATGQLIREFSAYSPYFTGGVYVAAGDVNGDGVADIITSPDVGGGPNVEVFSGRDGSLLANFLAYDPHFTGGVRVAAGDLDGDGKADIVTAPGAGGGPDVRVFGGASGQLIREFLAYSPFFTGGVYVAAGDINGDGKAEIITGAGAGGGPEVKVFSGADTSVLEDTLAFGAGFQGGVRVGYISNPGSGVAGAILAGAGPGGGPQAEVIAVSAAVLDAYYAYAPAFTGGVFVGGA
jgi:hypothetical protein